MTSSAGAIDPTAIPIGDGKYGSTPRVGYVDSCQTSFSSSAGGAQIDGPWIDQSNGTWNDQTKLSVSGQVSWAATASYKVSTNAQTRTIKFNDLPTDHDTGVFPIASSDPAHAYDGNPNHIAAQSYDWSLPLNPKAAASPHCVNMGAIGVLEDGVVLYNALDGEGRDAGAHEVLDVCGGHPDQSSTYHHHDIPSCITDSVPDGTTKLVGYAADGYGIYVVKNADGTMPTNTDLDACHGTTSSVMWNGRVTDIYHYVATLEYPYTVGCFHGTPITTSSGSKSGKSCSSSAKTAKSPKQGSCSTMPRGGGRPPFGPPPNNGPGSGRTGGSAPNGPPEQP